MPQQNLGRATQPDREIVIAYIFNAPRELLFKAWTEPQHIEQWFGPNH